jgi:hypothetical protein
MTSRCWNTSAPSSGTRSNGLYSFISLDLGEECGSNTDLVDQIKSTITRSMRGGEMPRRIDPRVRSEKHGADWLANRVVVRPRTLGIRV